MLKISASSPNHINAMDINADYAGEDDPILLKIEFIMSLCEQIMGSGKLGAQERSILGRCVNEVYQDYLQRGFTGEPPTLKDLYSVLLDQPDPEARSVAWRWSCSPPEASTSSHTRPTSTCPAVSSALIFWTWASGFGLWGCWSCWTPL